MKSAVAVCWTVMSHGVECWLF